MVVPDEPSSDTSQPQTPNDDAALPEGSRVLNNKSLWMNIGNQHYDQQLSHVKSFLPFLTRLFECSEMLSIPPHRVSKLKCLYAMVNKERLSLNKLKVCREIFYHLYDIFNKPLILYTRRCRNRRFDIIVL